MKMKLDNMNHARLAVFARALYIRNARLPLWAVVRIVWRAAK